MIKESDKGTGAVPPTVVWERAIRRGVIGRDGREDQGVTREVVPSKSQKWREYGTGILLQVVDIAKDDYTSSVPLLLWQMNEGLVSNSAL